MRCYDCEKVAPSLFPVELEIKKGIHLAAYVCWDCHKARRTKKVTDTCVYRLNAPKGGQ